MEQLKRAPISDVLGAVLSGLGSSQTLFVYLYSVYTSVLFKPLLFWVFFHMQSNLILIDTALSFGTLSFLQAKVLLIKWPLCLQGRFPDPKTYLPYPKSTIWNLYLRTLSVLKDWNKSLEGKKTLSHLVSLVSHRIKEKEFSVDLMHEQRNVE